MKYLLVPFMIIIVHSVAFPRIFYVGGSDGTATIQAAVDQTGAGDTVLVRSGTYHEKVKVNYNGSPSSYLVIKAAPGARPVIDGKNTLPVDNEWTKAKWQGLVELKGSYIVFSGFEVKNSMGRGIRVERTNSQHIEISDNNANYNWNAGIHVERSQHIVVKNNKVWQNARGNAGVHRGKEDWPGCLMFEDCQHGTIVGNEVYQNHGEGIIYLRSSEGLIEDNVCWDNLKVQLYLDNAARCTVQRNICYNTDDKEFWRWAPTHPGHGLYISNEEYPNALPHEQGRDMVIINNIVFRTGTGIAHWTQNRIANSALRNYLIAHNVVYDIYTNALHFMEPTADHDAKVYNNIIHSKDKMIVSHTWTGIDFKNNCWSKTPPSQAAGSADVIGDPKILAQGSTAGGELTAEYFRLTQNSPCIGNALILSEVSEDFFGTDRGNNPSIGAHEYQGSTSVGLHALHTFTTPGAGVFRGTFLLNGRFRAGPMRMGNTGASNVVILRSAGHSSNPVVTIVR